MGLISSLLGHANEIDVGALAEEFAPILFPGEGIHRAFQVFRDRLVFTTHRLILVDKQGITGSKVEYQSVFYRSITRFAVETPGTFDGDCDLKIWLSGSSEPITKHLKRGVDVISLQQSLAKFCLG